MTFGSLFAGIGGFDLGFERAGMACKWQVEIDPYCQRVLAKHWPNVRRHDDVRTFPPEGDWGVDVICGGFPCQDISYAGKGAGLAGGRSGLFYEAMRVVREVGPRIVVLENVAALLTRGLDQVLGTLASLGFDAEWDCVSAAHFGAPHIRDRTFIVAYANSQREQQSEGTVEKVRRWAGDGLASMPDSTSIRRPQGNHESRDDGLQSTARKGRLLKPERVSWWESEPRLGRLVDGVSRGVEHGARLKCLGNAVVPQVAEWIGRRLMEAQ